MKTFFDSNVYIAEALLGKAAERMISATIRGRWRIYCSDYVVEEVGQVMQRLGFSGRLAALTKRRIQRRSTFVACSSSRHSVATDPRDSPIIQAALACGADYLVSNDRHLLDLDPYEGLRVISMDVYLDVLKHRGLYR